jgi:protease-4
MQRMAVRAGVLVLLALATGCRGPLQAVTQSRVTMHSSPVEDRGPLVEKDVIGDDECRRDKIAIVDVDGLLVNNSLVGLGSLGENPVSLFREKLDAVAADPGYCAVVLRINSPGGGVTASDIMWRDLRAFREQTKLPVVACLMDLATGGAYYLATAADHVTAHPTTVTGGMGVILNLYNLKDAMAYFNIEAVPVRAGRFVDLGSPVEPMPEEGRAILQRVADEFHARFQEAVRQGRPRHDPARKEDFDGRVLTASQALECHLIDSIGYLDDAVATARQLGGCPTARAVLLRRVNDPARSPYATTPNSPMQGGLLPMSIPGLDRSQLPTFLYLWQPEPTFERRAAK